MAGTLPLGIGTKLSFFSFSQPFAVKAPQYNPFPILDCSSILVSSTGLLSLASALYREPSWIF